MPVVTLFVDYHPFWSLYLEIVCVRRAQVVVDVTNGGGGGLGGVPKEIPVISVTDQLVATAAILPHSPRPTSPLLSSIAGALLGLPQLVSDIALLLLFCIVG